MAVLIEKDGKFVDSELNGQAFASDQYFNGPYSVIDDSYKMPPPHPARSSTQPAPS